MDVAHIATKHTEDDNDSVCFVLPDDVSSATPEKKLLHSYDRFYKAVSKVAQDIDEEAAPLPSLDTVLGDVISSLPASHLETLKSVWQRAEGFCKLQRVVGKFHDYRSDVVRRLKRRSRGTSSESPFYMTNMEEGMKEVMEKQTSMEQQLQFSNTLLVGMEQRYEQIPVLMEEMLKKSRGLSETNEQTALGKIVNENRQQIQRMEELIEGLDARLRQWGPKEKEMSLPRSWPETVHNNIVYSSSEGSSTIDVNIPIASEEEALPRSAVAVPQSRLSESQLLSKSKAMAGMSLPNAQSPETVPVIMQNSSFEAKTCEQHQQQQQESILTSSSSALNSIPLSSASHLDDHFSSSTNKLSPYALETVSKETSSKETCTEMAAVHDKADDIILNAAFTEAFLKDVLLVQENIWTSALGNKTEKKSPGRRTRRRRSEMSPRGGVEHRRANNEEGDPVEMLFNLMGSESISFLNSSFSEFCPTTAPSCPMSILPNSALN